MSPRFPGFLWVSSHSLKERRENTMSEAWEGELSYEGGFRHTEFGEMPLKSPEQMPR